MQFRKFTNNYANSLILLMLVVSRYSSARKFCCVKKKQGNNAVLLPCFVVLSILIDYLFSAVATSTAQATVQPTIGLFPMPRKPIISTCAGTEDEPANCASECIRPIVSVIP